MVRRTSTGGSREREFVEYVTARRPHLLRFTYLLCGDWATAEDLLQTALTKLYLAWAGVRRDGTEEAYARKIIVRCVIDERRRPWRRETAVDRTPGSWESLDDATPAGPSYEDTDRLREAVRSLPARQRSVVVLRYWWGLSIAETAAELGCSDGTVKALASRGMGRLRTALANDHEHDMRGR